jgi:hypothetical protein
VVDSTAAKHAAATPPSFFRPYSSSCVANCEVIFAMRIAVRGEKATGFGSWLQQAQSRT